MRSFKDWRELGNSEDNALAALWAQTIAPKWLYAEHGLNARAARIMRHFVSPHMEGYCNLHN